MPIQGSSQVGAWGVQRLLLNQVDGSTQRRHSPFTRGDNHVSAGDDPERAMRSYGPVNLLKRPRTARMNQA